MYATEESIHMHVHNIDCCRAIQCEFKRGCPEQKSRGQYTSEPFRRSIDSKGLRGQFFTRSRQTGEDWVQIHQEYTRQFSHRVVVC